MNPLKLGAQGRYFKDLGNVEDQGKEKGWCGVLYDEAVEANTSVPVVVVVRQANSLRRGLYI